MNELEARMIENAREEASCPTSKCDLLQIHQAGCPFRSEEDEKAEMDTESAVEMMRADPVDY